MKTNGSDTVYPATEDHGLNTPLYGLTKREYFAAMAMQGLLANSFSDGVTQPLSTASKEQISKIAVDQADALIAELNNL